MRNKIYSGNGWLRNLHSKNNSFHGTWEYYENGWKQDKDLYITALGTNRKCNNDSNEYLFLAY